MVWLGLCWGEEELGVDELLPGWMTLLATNDDAMRLPLKPKHDRNDRDGCDCDSGG